jgi:hypothetical protein
LTICSAKNRLALKIWNTFVLQLEDEVKEMVLEPVYLTEKLSYIIQMFGSIVSACWLQIHLSFVANFSEQFIFSMNMFFSLLTCCFGINSLKNLDLN